MPELKHSKPSSFAVIPHSDARQSFITALKLPSHRHQVIPHSDAESHQPRQSSMAGLMFPLSLSYFPLLNTYGIPTPISYMVLPIYNPYGIKRLFHYRLFLCDSAPECGMTMSVCKRATAGAPLRLSPFFSRL